MLGPSDAARLTSPAALLGMVLIALAGCATQPPSAARALSVTCAAKHVRYCVESGSRAEDGACRCLTQEAAQISLESL